MTVLPPTMDHNSIDGVQEWWGITDELGKRSFGSGSGCRRNIDSTLLKIGLLTLSCASKRRLHPLTCAAGLMFRTWGLSALLSTFRNHVHAHACHCALRGLWSLWRVWICNFRDVNYVMIDGMLYMYSLRAAW